MFWQKIFVFVTHPRTRNNRGVPHLPYLWLIQYLWNCGLLQQSILTVRDCCPEVFKCVHSLSPPFQSPSCMQGIYNSPSSTDRDSAWPHCTKALGLRIYHKDRFYAEYGIAASYSEYSPLQTRKFLCCFEVNVELWVGRIALVCMCVHQ